jgi:hypothetical protein
MKLLLRLVFVGIALVVVVAVLGIASVGRIVQAAVEKGGSHALGVPTTLAEANIGLFSGEFGMSGLEVANPAGFEREHFLSMNQAELAVSLGSLRSELVEVPRVVFDGIALSLERREGKTNYGTILENLERLKGERESGGEEPPGEEEPAEKEEKDDAPQKRFVVRQVVLRNIVAHVDLLPVGGQWTKTSIELPELVLENVGNEEGSIADVTSQVVTALIAAVVQAGGDRIPAGMLDDLQGQLEALASSYQLDPATLAELDALADGLGDQVSEQLGEKADELIDDAGKQLGEELEGLFKRD